MTKLPRSEYGDAIQAVYPGTTQTVAISGTSAQTTNAVDSYVVRLISTSACFIKFGSDPTASSSEAYLPAETAEYFAINPGDKVAVIQSASSGTLYVTEGS